MNTLLYCFSSCIIVLRIPCPSLPPQCCVHTQNLPNDLQGHLYELGRFKRWEKKWFVLDVNFLTSYATFEVRAFDLTRCSDAHIDPNTLQEDCASGHRACVQSGPDERRRGDASHHDCCRAETCAFHLHSCTCAASRSFIPSSDSKRQPSSNPPPNVTRVQFFLRGDSVEDTSNWLTVLTTWLDSAKHQLGMAQPIGGHDRLAGSHPHRTSLSQCSSLLLYFLFFICFFSYHTQSSFERRTHAYTATGPPARMAASASETRLPLHATPPDGKSTTTGASVDSSQPSSFFALPPYTPPNKPVPPAPLSPSRSARALPKSPPTGATHHLSLSFFLSFFFSQLDTLHTM
jgi:hypothetical protein